MSVYGNFLAAVFGSCGCFCRCHRLFFQQYHCRWFTANVNDFFPIVVCCCCCCYCDDLSITSTKCSTFIWFWLWNIPLKMQAKTEPCKELFKEKIVEAQRTKKHMLYVLSSKASWFLWILQRSPASLAGLPPLGWLTMVTVALAAAATAVAPLLSSL